MTGLVRAWLRLLALQGAWNYQRMQGIGAGWAAEPLLEPLRASDPERHRGAVARSAAFFNAHPYLAGLAVGAAARAELDGAPPEQVARLRTVLGTPLGALGDQLFWAGLLPIAAAAAIIGTTLGAGTVAVPAAVALYASARLWTTHWALRTGLAHGALVGRALGASWLPRAVPRVAALAALALGAALPLAVRWYLSGLPMPLRLGAAVVGVAVAGVVLGRLAGPRVSALRFGLGAAALTLLFRWVTA